MPIASFHQRLVKSFVLAGLCAPSLAWAQTGSASSGGVQAPAPDEAGAAAAGAVQQVVVTANRYPIAIDEVGQSITVLTASDLRLDQETNLADVLVRTPGLSLSRNGGPGQTTSLFIRGAESAQTVVLIDGVKVNDPTDPDAGFDLSTLISGDIARVEVLRGPQSTLYGSEAIGGVVNIVTAEATRPVQGDLQAEGGSYGTAFAKGDLGGETGKLNWRVGAYYDTTDSVSAFAGGPYPSGFDTAGVSARARYDLTPDLQVDERAYYSDSRVHFDGYDTPSGDFGDDSEFGRTQQFVDYTGLNLSLLDGRFKNRLAFEYNGLDRRDEDPQQPLTKFTFLAMGRASTVEYEGSYALTDEDRAVFGAQTVRSTIDTDSPYYDIAYGDLPTRAAVNETSGYGQLTGQVFKGLTVTLGGRYDENSAFGGHATGQASAAWALFGGGTILRASFGQGFKAPSLYELYSEYGDPSLRPEQAEGWDAGVEQHAFGGRLVMQATYFGRDTRDLIDFVDCYGVLTGGCATHQTYGGYYDNVARAQAQGLELQSTLKATSRLTVSGNYTFDDTEDRSPGSPTYGLQLPRRPKNTANLTADYLWPVNLRTDIAVRYAGQSFDDAAHAIPLKAYALVDVRASYPLGDQVELYGRIENLGDTRYETAYQYGTLGRAAYGGVRFSF